MTKLIMTTLPTVRFLGCPVAACEYTAALDWMISAVEQRCSTYLVTLNAQYLWQMAHDNTFKNYVLKAGLVVPEYAVVWGARRLGMANLRHIGGINLVRDFLNLCPTKGFRVYLLGANKSVVGALADQLSRRFGQDLVVGWHDGYLLPDVEKYVAEEIEHLRPDVVFVAMGLPKQDRWIQNYGHKLGIPLCMGVGGSFDVLAGFKPDTPPWARGKGLEWLYRIWIDPRAYLRRYMTVNIWFMAQVYREKWNM